MRRWLNMAAVALAVLMSALARPASALAQERIAIPSETPDSMGAYLHHAGAPVTVVGYLYLPAGQGPFPAMILKHGSGGLEGAHGDNIAKWAHAFNSWGVAAFVIDSYGPRGLSSTAADQGALKPWADLADAFNGLKVLAADPRIDPTRIGIMGWSRGGSIAMETALESARLAVLAPTDPKFAAHIVFYGSAETQYRDTATDKAPMLFFHGETDDYVPIGPTKEFADWIQTMGDPVQFVTYPNTYHDFDVEGGHNGFARTVQTAHNCDAVIDLSSGHVARADHKPVASMTPQAFMSYYHQCTTTGATLAYNAQARADAVEKVHAFISQVFHLAN